MDKEQENYSEQMRFLLNDVSSMFRIMDMAFEPEVRRVSELTHELVEDAEEVLKMVNL